MVTPPYDYLWSVVLAASLTLLVAVAMVRRGHVAWRELVPALLLLVVLQPFAWLYVEGAGLEARERIFSSLIAFAPTYAEEMAHLGHAAITPDTPEDDPAYLRMIDAEKRWLMANPHAADIYTFRTLADGRIIFVVDAETDYDGDGLYEGEREARTEIGEELVTKLRGPIDRAMTGVSLVDDDIEADRWGVWISSYAPIAGPDGKPEALLGIDYRADDYLAAVAGARGRAIGVAAAIGLVLMSMSLVNILLRHNLAEREQRNLELDAAAREVLRLNSDLEDSVRHRTAELERANRELEAFAYSVSHDLRTPLRTIEGFAGLVMAESGDRLSPESRANLARVQKASRHMALLISDLLRLSRVARAELHIEHIDVTAMVKQVAAEIAERYPGRQVELRVAPGLVADADRPLLEVLFNNALDNAWKYTAGRERAVVEVGQGEAGVWFLRDNGCGFDMRFVDKLFRPFQRLHTDSEYEGTGIGLATVARVVERHGGTVTAEAEPDVGCTIFFTLAPAAASSRA